jgi:hypothetical protein
VTHATEAERATGATPEAASDGRRGLLGEILVREGLITEAQLETALLVQRESEPATPLGQILVRQNALTQRQLNTVLDRYRKKYRLGDILVETETITEHQLQIALDHQKRTGLRLGDTLLQLNFLTEDELNQALCKQFGVTFVDLDRLVLDRSLAVLIEREYAERHRVIPISKTDRVLVVAMDDPSDLRVVAELAARSGCRINIVTSSHAAFRRAFTRTYGESAEDGLARRAEEVGRAYDALRLEHAVVEDRLAEAERGRQALVAEREAWARTLAEQRTRNESNQQALEDLRAAHAALRADHEAVQATLAGLRSEHAAVMDALSELRQRHHSLAADQRARAEQLAEQTARNDANLRALADLADAQRALRAEHAALQEELGRARARGGETEARLAELRRAHQGLVQDRAGMLAEIEAAMDRLRA